MLSEVFNVRTMLENLLEHHCVVNFFKDSRAAVQNLQIGRPAKQRREDVNTCEIQRSKFYPKISSIQFATPRLRRR